MKRLLSVGGIAVGLALGVLGFGLGAVGLMAMGTDGPKLVVFLAGVLLLAAAVALVVKSALALRKGRPRASA
ncbi:MAG TPA: hypothetical protein VN719_06990 [Gemmatimonadales bacterium]|nr:hypothetical protein [Gemmatimonadales bacterium]